MGNTRNNSVKDLWTIEYQTKDGWSTSTMLGKTGGYKLETVIGIMCQAEEHRLFNNLGTYRLRNLKTKEVLSWGVLSPIVQKSR